MPQTYYLLDSTQFAAKPNSSNSIVGGMLNLPGESYFLMDIDVDGAMHKMVNLASSLQQQQSMKSIDTPTTDGVATLRSAGLAIVKTGRAEDLASAIVQAKTLNSTVQNSTPTMLYADDLMRGLRIDVWESVSQSWHSLHRRVGTYNFPTAPSSLQTVTIHDEGQMSTGVTRKLGVSSDLNVHEAIAHWENWSLSAPKPGSPLDQDGNPTTTTNTPQTPFQLAVSFAAEPGTLPLQRFGTKYRLRARVVDLAGNSLPSGTTNDAGALPPAASPMKYRRYEPVVAPVVLLHDAIADASGNSLSPGEAVRRLVVRSDYPTSGQDTPTSWVAYANPLVASEGITFLVSSQRYIAPPRTSEQLAELHGMFDTRVGHDGPNPSQTTYNSIVAGTGRFSSDLYNPAGTNPPGTVPYFPDVLSRGAYFTGLPGTTTDVSQPFAGTWPSLMPFLILLQGIPDGTAPAAPSFANGILTVQLPQGEMVTVNLSSYLNQADLDLMVVWQWIQEYIAAGNPVTPFVQGLASLTLQGLHFMLTPFQPITLVHAVQRPLGSPEFSTAFHDNGGPTGLIRNPGETFVTFLDNMHIDGKSTNKVDVYATWTEHTDIPPDDPGTVSGNKHAFQAPVQPYNTAITLNEQDHYGDTKHRTVTYQAKATSRFREYFPDAIINSQEGIIRAGTAVTKNVLSSARPDAPKALYIVPTFEWSTPDVSPLTRKGNRLRIYLARPWYSSGDGELLGVVTLNGDCTPEIAQPAAQPPHLMRLVKQRRRKHLQRLVTTPTCDSVKLYVSQWGSDPVFNDGSTFTQMPHTDNFSALATKTATGLMLAELPNLVDVSGFSVEFDSSRKLWYADIEVDTSAYGQPYFPFLRLALARYQPNSVSGHSLELSKVVMADFIQLPPDRTLSVTMSADKNSVAVSVTGVVGQSLETSSSSSGNVVGGSIGSFITSMDVLVEQNTAGEVATSGDDTLGWAQVGNPITLTADSNSPGMRTWSTPATTPIDISSLTGTIRLVVREHESFYAQDPHPLVSGSIFSSSAQTQGRIVYAATFDLQR
jgi:hypothetical protein